MRRGGVIVRRSSGYIVLSALTAMVPRWMQAGHPLCPLIHANERWRIGKDGFPSVDAPWPSRSGRVSDAAMRQESSVIAATAATPAATATALLQLLLLLQLQLLLQLLLLKHNKTYRLFDFESP